MRFITVGDLRSRPSQVWQQLAQEKELVITKDGKPIALLVPASEDMLEEQLRAHRCALAMQAAAAMQEASARRGLDRMNLEEINAVIREVRKKRVR